MLLLIHGGLWDNMDADRFWHKPGTLAHPERIKRLLLVWPATAGDPKVGVLPSIPESSYHQWHTVEAVRTVTEFVAS